MPSTTLPDALRSDVRSSGTSTASTTPSGRSMSSSGRELLRERGLLDRIRSAMLISRPYQQRRSWAITRKRWPQIEILCSARPLPLEEYIAGIGDVDRVITMLVGDTQRLWVYPAKGWAAAVPIPVEVRAAYQRQPSRLRRRGWACPWRAC